MFPRIISNIDGGTYPLAVYVKCWSPSSQYSSKQFLRTFKHFAFPSLSQCITAEVVSCSNFLPVFHTHAKETWVCKEHPGSLLEQSFIAQLTKHKQQQVLNNEKIKEPHKDSPKCSEWYIYIYKISNFKQGKKLNLRGTECWWFVL